MFAHFAAAQEIERHIQQLESLFNETMRAFEK